MHTGGKPSGGSHSHSHSHNHSNNNYGNPRNHHDTKIAGLYDLEETLGRGHFAVVKRARHVFTGEKVAVKVIDKMKLDEVSRAHLYQEVRCMKLVQHPNVVRLYQVIDTQTKLYLILELGDGGDLYDYIMKHESGLGEDMAREYFRQIVRAISYCHQLHVVHRDLKPENVVFFERLGVVKLTDFGFSNKFCPGQKLETSCGSLAYSAPEILLGDSYDAPAVDIWSLGVILYMLVVGQAPFQEANDSETLTMIMDCKYKVPSHVSQTCRRLIARMLVREPDARAKLHEIATDTWLGGPDHNAEYLPLVSHHQLTEEDQAMIVNKMVTGEIATKEEIIDALERNEYNHITATYYLIAERKLRLQRMEDAQARANQNKIIHNLAVTSKNCKATVDPKGEASTSPHLLGDQNLQQTSPQVQTHGQGSRIRKCSIVHEEEDDEEEDYSHAGQDLSSSSARSSLNRRGSRSEGKLNIAIQERIAEERRKDKKEPALSGSGPAGVRDDACRQARRSPTTSISKLTSTTTLFLTDSSTAPQPLTPSHHVSPDSNVPPLTKFKTLPSPTRNPTTSSSAAMHLNEICEEAIAEAFTPRNAGASFERRAKFRKTRTASCSSSEASDDDSNESRKKRAAKMGGQTRRRSHDDPSEDHDGPGPPSSGAGSGGSGGGREGDCGGGGGSGSHHYQPPTSSSGAAMDGSGSGARSPPPTAAGRRRASAQTRLRESQSLNRIAEVHEPVATAATAAVIARCQLEVVEEPCGKSASSSSKGLGAKFLKTWSRTRFANFTHHSHNLPNSNISDEEKENRSRKVKLLGRYFQVSKKLFIPVPSIVSKGRLYKARSCGAISRDRVAPDNINNNSKPFLNNSADDSNKNKICTSLSSKGKRCSGTSESVSSSSTSFNKVVDKS